MAYETGLSIANNQKKAMASFARAYADAQADGEVSRFEWFMMTPLAMNIGLQIALLLKGTPPEDVKELLYVWEKGVIVLPDEA